MCLERYIYLQLWYNWQLYWTLKGTNSIQSPGWNATDSLQVCDVTTTPKHYVPTGSSQLTLPHPPAPIRLCLWCHWTRWMAVLSAKILSGSMEGSCAEFPAPQGTFSLRRSRSTLLKWAWPKDVHEQQLVSWKLEITQHLLEPLSQIPWIHCRRLWLLTSTTSWSVGVWAKPRENMLATPSGPCTTARLLWHVVC